MNKYWYVVQNLKDKEKKEYLIGFLYGRSDTTEEELIKYVQEYCEKKHFRLALLIQLAPVIMIVNQVYPFEVTEESAMCLQYALQTITEGK